jgi:hypothetical protein
MRRRSSSEASFPARAVLQLALADRTTSVRAGRVRVANALRGRKSVHHHHELVAAEPQRRAVALQDVGDRGAHLEDHAPQDSGTPPAPRLSNQNLQGGTAGVEAAGCPRPPRTGGEQRRQGQERSRGARVDWSRRRFSSRLVSSSATSASSRVLSAARCRAAAWPRRRAGRPPRLVARAWPGRGRPRASPAGRAAHTGRPRRARRRGRRGCRLLGRAVPEREGRGASTNSAPKPLR